MDNRVNLARKKSDNIESSDSEYTITCEDREVTAIESSTISIDTTLDFMKQKLIDMRRKEEQDRRERERNRDEEKRGVGKNRYRENESNVKLKLKKGVYRKSKKCTKEKWNMTFVCLRNNSNWSY